MDQRIIGGKAEVSTQHFQLPSIIKKERGSDTITRKAASQRWQHRRWSCPKAGWTSRWRRRQQDPRQNCHTRHVL